jgi:hypothetical protein
MNRGDFAQDVRPLLKQIGDDPNMQEAARQSEGTTSPMDVEGLEGDLYPLGSDGDDAHWEVIGDTALNEGDVEAADDAYEGSGVDVLAFYKSFRNVDKAPFIGRWGAFLFDIGIAALARRLSYAGLRSPSNEVREFAAHVLLAHERYHFWVDAWTLNQEVLPLGEWRKRYVYYRAEARKNALTEHDIEESLANHYVFSRLCDRVLSDGTVVRAALKAVLAECPEPYSIFVFSPNERIKVESYLAFGAANGVATQLRDVGGRLDGTVPLGGGIQPPHPRHPTLGSHRCPAYVVRARNYRGLVAPFQCPRLDELEQFVVRYLDGAREKRTDHQYYRIDNGEKLKMPNVHHKEAKWPEFSGILRKAGMTRTDFYEARDNTLSWKQNCPRKPSKPPLG